MRVTSTLLVALAASALVSAQASTTLPKGFDTTAGSSNHWSGWDRVATYAPAVTTYWYDQSQFPWGTGAKALLGFKVRRDDGTATYGAHTKKMRVYLSTNGNGDIRRPVFTFSRAHGSDKKMVVGTTAAPATISFLATPPPGAGKVAPFDVDFKFVSPFPVLAGAKNLVVEFRTYGGSASVSWRPDAQFYSGTLSRGSVATLGTGCPTNYNTSNFISWPNGELIAYADTGKANTPTFLMFGPRLATPIPIPGAPGCNLYQNPAIFIPGKAENAARGRALFSILVPDDPKIAGAKVTYQFVVQNGTGPILGQLGLTRGREYTFGSGYSSGVQGVTVYSYGSSVSADALGDTGQASFLSNRHLIMQPY